MEELFVGDLSLGNYYCTIKEIELKTNVNHTK